MLNQILKVGACLSHFNEQGGGERKLLCGWRSPPIDARRRFLTSKRNVVWLVRCHFFDSSLPSTTRIFENWNIKKKNRTLNTRKEQVRLRRWTNRKSRPPFHYAFFFHDTSPFVLNICHRVPLVRHPSTIQSLRNNAANFIPTQKFNSTLLFEIRIICNLSPRCKIK